MPNTKVNSKTKVKYLTPEQHAARRHRELQQKHKRRARTLGITVEEYREIIKTPLREQKWIGFGLQQQQPNSPSLPPPPPPTTPITPPPTHCEHCESRRVRPEVRHVAVQFDGPEPKHDDDELGWIRFYDHTFECEYCGSRESRMGRCYYCSADAPWLLKWLQPTAGPTDSGN